MTKATTKSNKPTWREQITSMIADAQIAVTEAENEFNARATEHGILFAVQHGAESLARAKGVWRLFAAVQKLMSTANKMQANDTDLAYQLLDLLDRLKDDSMQDSADRAYTGNLFANALLDAEISGFIVALTSKERDGAYLIRQTIWKAGVLKPGQPNFEPCSIEEIIEHHKYMSLYHDKGWSEMSAAVRCNHPDEIAEAVLSWITDALEG